ncbi:M20/M25/M40 family metallo-hydrolase, partial [candidate division WOR-3 bacterium]|nr:M20/M25/M40 family metallo-hydrolase [candidate division WOR-3 bacterium]
MHIKMSGCLLLAVMALSAVAGPSRIALVPARGSAELERLAQAGVMVYGRAPGLILAEPSSLPAGQAGVVEVQLAEERETYLVQSPRDPGLLPKAAVWREDNVALVQLSATELAEMQRLGLEFQRLPVRPHRLWLAPAKQHPLPTATDTLIQRLVARVSADSIRRQMRRLQDFRTRFSFTDSCRAAEQYICDYFTALSLDSVQLDTFQFHGVTMRNVVGTKLGRRSPDQVAIICGHMDATSEDPYNSAPGAEDNVSGTAVAIEAARVLAAQTLDQTVKFIAFTAEEQGLIGSYHYAGLMRNRNADISGALNFDMIAWPGGQFGVTIVCDSNS